MIPFAPGKAGVDFAASPALQDSLGTLTYEELAHTVRLLAGRLQKIGVRSGDVVAVMLPPGREYIILFWALLACGALVVPLNDRLPVPALQRQIEQTAGAFIFSAKDRLKQFTGARPLSPEQCFADLAAEEPRPLPEEVNENQPATVIFTSGSTGRPAAALHSYGNHYYSALGSNANIKLTPGERWMLALPLYHVSGISILFRAALAGAATVIAQSGLSLHENIKAYSPTHISLVAAQFSRLLEEPESVERLSVMKAILLGGSAFPPDLIKRALKLKLPIHISYGSTEMASQICTTKSGADLGELQTSGNVLLYRQVKISAQGEVLVKGKTLFLGYLEKGRIRRPLNAEGWFASGDLGFFDGQKRLVISGRRDRMFISGGENIQPEEIERWLQKLPRVRRAVVVPVRDKRFGRRPVAFVKTSGRQPVEEEALRAGLAESLPDYKIPIRFLPWPANADGAVKINLKQLEKEAEKIILNTEEHL